MGAHFTFSRRMITEEGKVLGNHWDRIGSDTLDRYLVQDVENPAFNPQSVLIRAFLLDRLFSGEASKLIEEELFFATCCCFALLGHREGWFPDLYRKVKSACPNPDLPVFLRSGNRQRHGARFELSDVYSELAICIAVGFDDFASPFERLWKDWIRNRDAEPIKLLELGCGSANDFRYFDSYGLTEFCEYSGIDASGANIRNAKRRFPNVQFRVGDACAIGAADQSFDVTVAFDLYEHLSEDALSLAISESLRVTKDELWMSLFNAADIPSHRIEPVDDYHWNLLSLWELQTDIQAQGFDVEIISVAQHLEGRYEGYRHYNQEAYILIATRRSTKAEQTTGKPATRSVVKPEGGDNAQPEAEGLSR